MSRVFSRDWWTEAALGRIPGHAVVHKFGEAQVGTTLVPVTKDLVYQTPTAATALEFVSSDANDTAAGSGAREVTVIGLNSAWAEVTQTVATNGTTAVALSTNLIRLYRWYVSASGTYATQSAGSHAGTLTIRVASAGATWSTIGLEAGLASGQSKIGAYTVPAGKTAWVRPPSISADSTKAVDVYFFQRPGADTVAAPFSALRVVNQYIGVSGSLTPPPGSPFGPFPGPCDIGFLAVVAAGTGDISVDFEVLLIDN